MSKSVKKKSCPMKKMEESELLCLQRQLRKMNLIIRHIAWQLNKFLKMTLNCLASNISKNNLAQSYMTWNSKPYLQTSLMNA